MTSLPATIQPLMKDVVSTIKNDSFAGVTNYPVTFKGGRYKAIIIYMDAFNDDERKSLRSSMHIAIYAQRS